MESPLPPSGAATRGSLDDFLVAADVVPLPRFTDEEWDAMRPAAGRALGRTFCTLRNLWVHRGDFAADAMGFAWGGIYRTLLVGPIVATSYRNEGHVRAGERIGGTRDFFYGAYVLPRSSPEFRDIVAMVNLRHHVAGVVRPTGEGGYRVIDGYEADYCYVATAFVESMRRGMAACGLPPESPRGRAIAGRLCAILYQFAGFTGLARVPRDLDAHERFRDAYDRHLRARPASPRVRRMAQEIARRIVPVTAVMAGSTVRAHVVRHVDAETRDHLFPDGITEELEHRRREWQRRIVGTNTLGAIRERAGRRVAIRKRADLASLQEAHRRAASDLTADRLIGAILLHGIDDADGAARPFERRTIELAAGEDLIRQGDRVERMYVLLSATAPLDVLHAPAPGEEPRRVATVDPPTVLGEIGMWRGRPAVATVRSPVANRVETIVIDAARFAELRQEPGFRAATAAEVQRRLALNAALATRFLDEEARSRGDPRLASIAQLLRYLSGDSHSRLDAVVDLAEDASPAECLDALRRQVDAAIHGGGLDPELQRVLTEVTSTIG